MTKKIIALLTALLLCLCMVSCANQDPDAPDGMQSVTLAGEPFRLYVPERWASNTDSGVSSAYYSSTHKVLVTARYYTPADESLTLDAYVTACAEAYAATLDGFEEQERIDAVLGKENAVKMTYTMLDGSVNMRCFQISTYYKGDIVSLNVYCDTEVYDTVLTDLELIVSSFVLCEKAAPQGTELIDKKTPAGMEIASAEHLEYRLYVPTAWICNADSGMSEAYYPESGRSNISVTSFAPELSTTVQDYFLECEKSYAASLPNYERISESPTERQVAGRIAYSYVYRVVADGVEFRIMQTMLAYNDMLYSITYTALAENFELHMNDVEAILNAFTFR